MNSNNQKSSARFALSTALVLLMAFACFAWASAGKPAVAFAADAADSAGATDATGAGDAAGTESPADAAVIPVELDFGGLVPAGAQMTLTTADGTIIESWEASGETKTLNLAPGKYVLTEVAAPKGYEEVTTIPFTVDANGNVTIDDEPASDDPAGDEPAAPAEIHDSIVWDDLDNAMKLRPASVSVQPVYSLDGGKTWKNQGDPQDVSGKMNSKTWDVDITDLPATIDGVVPQWSLRLAAIPDGYAVDSSADTLTIKLNPVCMVTLRSTDMSGKILKGATFRVQKQVEDPANPDSTTYEAYLDGDYVSDDDGTADVDFIDGVYVISETVAPEGYLKAKPATIEVANGEIVSYKGDGASIGGVGIPLPSAAIAKGDISVSKIWNDASNLYGLRPAKATLELYRSISGSIAQPEKVGTQELSGKGDTWNAVFKGMPATNSDGEAYVYTVKEANTDANYEASVESDGLTVINSIMGVKVGIRTYDLQTGASLAGAKMELKSHVNNAVVDAWTSTLEAHEVFLPTGEYTLTQTSDIDGYTRASDVTIRVNADGSIDRLSNGKWVPMDSTDEPTEEKKADDEKKADEKKAQEEPKVEKTETSAQDNQAMTGVVKTTQPATSPATSSVKSTPSTNDDMSMFAAIVTMIMTAAGATALVARRRSMR